MRDRLIELLNNVQDKGFISAKNEDEISCSVSNDVVADKILADGWMRPPCKVGDKVYCIVEGFDVVMEGHIRQLIVAEGIFIDCVIRGYFNQVFHSSKIGKTVFFTKEEAEQALICRKSRQDEEGGVRE